MKKEVANFSKLETYDTDKVTAQVLNKIAAVRGETRKPERKEINKKITTTVNLETFIRIYKNVFKVELPLEVDEPIINFKQEPKIPNLKIHPKDDSGELKFEVSQLKAVNFSKYTTHDPADEPDLSRTNPDYLEKLAETGRSKLFTTKAFKRFNEMSKAMKIGGKRYAFSASVAQNFCTMRCLSHF